MLFLQHPEMSLTEEQRKRIEESRQKALALRASRQLNSVDKGSVGKDSVGTPVATQIHHGLTTFSSCKSTNPSENVCKEVESKKPLYTELIDSRNSKQSACAKAPYGCFRGNGRTSVSAEGIKPAGSAIKSDLNAGSDAVVVKCLLVSRERFAVDMRYYPAVIEILKRITSRQYG